MNILNKILFGTSVSVFLLLTSCVKEHNTAVDSEDVSITLNVGTRATPEQEGDAQDRYINSMRMLVYQYSSGKLVFNHKLYGVPTAESAREDYTGTVEMKTGQFTVVFIANELSDRKDTDPSYIKLTDQLEAIEVDDPNTNTLSYLKSLSFCDQAFASNIDIPMVTVREGIIVQGTNKLVDETGNAQTKLEVSMERLGIRIDLTLKLLPEQWTAWQSEQGKVSFSNIPGEVFLFSGIENAPATLSRDVVIADYDDDSTVDSDGLIVIPTSRIILPELYSANIDAINGLILKINAPSEFTGAIYAGEKKADNLTDNYALPRNLRLGLTAKIGEVSITFNTNVMDWTDVGLDNKELQ